MPQTRMDAVDRIVEQTERERPDLDAQAVELLSRITRAGRLVEAATARSLARFALGLGDFWLLVALRRAGPPFQLTPTELLRNVTVTSGAVSQQLERLEQRKLVHRRPSPIDRRGVIVELSTTGRQLIDAAWAAHVNRDRVLFSGLTSQQRRALADLLRHVTLVAEGDEGDGRRRLASTVASEAPQNR